MSSEGAPLLTETPSLAQLLDRAAIAELCRSAHEQFGVRLSVSASDGRPLSPLTRENEQVEGAVCSEMPICYEGQILGRVVVSGARASADALPKFACHFAQVIELLLFSGHRAHLASEMQLMSDEVNYRELAARNAELQEAYDKLKEVDRLKSTFLATMSHELRTPLTSIIGYSEMLAGGMGGVLNATQQEFVDTIRAKGDHLLELILTLLDVARLEQDQLRITKVPIRPDQLADDVLRTVSPAAAKKSIRLDALIAEALPSAFADEARLRQVLLNLLDNAVKFTPRGGTVTLEVSEAALDRGAGDDDAGLVLLDAPGRAVQFTIRDTGIGIPASEQTRIFDAFYQVDGSATREHGGTGLGLSIVKRLVEAHDGTIEVESSEGLGSTFRVRIAAVD